MRVSNENLNFHLRNRKKEQIKLKTRRWKLIKTQKEVNYFKDGENQQKQMFL